MPFTRANLGRILASRPGGDLARLKAALREVQADPAPSRINSVTQYLLDLEQRSPGEGLLGTYAARQNPEAFRALLEAEAARAGEAGPTPLHDTVALNVLTHAPRRGLPSAFRRLNQVDGPVGLWSRMLQRRAPTLDAVAGEHLPAFRRAYELQLLDTADPKLAAERAFAELERSRDLAFTDLRKARLFAAVQGASAGAGERFVHESGNGLPESLGSHFGDFYAETGRAAEPSRVARLPLDRGTDNADPIWWSDHGMGHMRNITQEVPDTLLSARASGLLEPREDLRRWEWMELAGRAIGMKHDMWMKDLTPAGRSAHPNRAAREAFSGQAPFEAAMDDLLDAGAGSMLHSTYGIPAQDTPRVLREALSLSHAHSKSKIPLELLNDPARLRDEMQQVVLAEDHAVAGVADLSAYGGAEGFRARSYDWLVNNPALAEDMVDLMRTVRVADSFRWRGADFHGSQEAVIGTVAYGDHLQALMRLADPETGRTYHVRYHHPPAMGESNVTRTALGPNGELTLGIRQSLPGQPGEELAEHTALVFADVWKDFVGSFNSAVNKPIILEAPPGPDGAAFAQRVVRAMKAEIMQNAGVTARSSDQAPVHSSPALLKYLERARENLATFEQLERSNGIRITTAPAPFRDTQRAALRATQIERQRFDAAPPLALDSLQRYQLARLVRDGGMATESMRFDAPDGALEGARLVTLKKGEPLMARDADADFVYVPLEDDAFTVGMAREYQAPPARAGVPLGGVNALGGTARTTDVVALQDGAKAIAIPAETYRREWLPHFYTHDQREGERVITPGTLLQRLQADYPEELASS